MIFQGLGFSTGGDVARGDGATEVHDAEGDHLLVAIDVIVSKSSEGASDGNTLRERNKRRNQTNLSSCASQRPGEKELMCRNRVQSLLDVSDLNQTINPTSIRTSSDHNTSKNHERKKNAGYSQS